MPSSWNSLSIGDSDMPSALLTAISTFFCDSAQVARDVVVLRRQAGAHVHDEHHDVGLGHGLARLARHLLDDAGGRVGLEAAGVDDDELDAVVAAVAVVAVAREAGEVGDDRVARLGHAG